MGVDVCGRIIAIEVSFDGVVVAPIKGCKLALVSLLLLPVTCLVDELVKISFFEVVLFEETDIVSFRDKVSPVVVTAPLVGRFGFIINDTPLHEEWCCGRDTHF